MIQTLLVMTSTCSYPNSKFLICSFQTEMLALRSENCWKDSKFPYFPNLQWQVAIQIFCYDSKSAYKGLREVFANFRIYWNPLKFDYFSPKFCQCYLLGVPYLLLSLLIVNLEFFLYEKTRQTEVSS